MRLAVRDDDSELLELIRDRTNLGTLRQEPARGSSKPQTVWHVGSKADCMRLSDLLVRYPLRGRKGGDFALWLDAVRWWVGADPTQRRVNRDWEPVVYIKRRLEANHSFSPNPSPIRDSVRGMSPDWIALLSGLFTADGHFGVHVNGGSFARWHGFCCGRTTPRSCASSGNGPELDDCSSGTYRHGGNARRGVVVRTRCGRFQTTRRAPRYLPAARQESPRLPPVASRGSRVRVGCQQRSPSQASSHSY